MSPIPGERDGNAPARRGSLCGYALAFALGGAFAAVLIALLGPVWVYEATHMALSRSPKIR